MFVAIIGHVDNGKSSLLSRIIYPDKGGNISELDFLEEEAATGNTFEYSIHKAAQEISFVDTAGHVCFIRSNIEAYTKLPISVALIVCSLRRGEFEAGFLSKEERLSPLKEQILLLRCSGVRSAVVVLTKADLESSLKDDEENILAPLQSFLQSIQIKCIHKAVCSAKNGSGIDDLFSYLCSIQAPTPASISTILVGPGPLRCAFRILFIPKGKVITAGCIFMAHGQGKESACALHEVCGEVRKGDMLHLKTPVLSLYKEYMVILVLKKKMPVTKRIILRLSNTTVGYCTL